MNLKTKLFVHRNEMDISNHINNAKGFCYYEFNNCIRLPKLFGLLKKFQECDLNQ